MTARLDVFEERNEFIVAWDDEGYPGLVLGDPGAPSDSEHVTASSAAEALGTHHRRFDQTFAWEVRAEATQALRAARAALKAAKAAKAGKPWPDWALKASAEGWKPPRGWTP